MRRHYLITHGETEEGEDPKHTEAGLEKIRAIQLPREITAIVTGTGQRMVEVLEIVSSQIFPKIRVIFSPFCGSANRLTAENKIILSSGQAVDLLNYDGLDNFAFDAWGWVAQYRDNTIFLTGGELMKAFGQTSEKGQLYELYVQKRTARKIG